MKKIFYSLIVLTIISCLVSCKCNTGKNTSVKSEENTNVAPDMHTAENSLDFYGSYEGIIPAASTPGMKLTLILAKDKTYNLLTVYMDKENDKFTDEGVFTIENSIITLDLKNGQKQYYKIEEGRLVFLDQEKNKITGNLADQYILKQIIVD